MNGESGDKVYIACLLPADWKLGVLPQEGIGPPFLMYRQGPCGIDSSVELTQLALLMESACLPHAGGSLLVRGHSVAGPSLIPTVHMVVLKVEFGHGVNFPCGVLFLLLPPEYKLMML